jgi:hypothetical protein
VQDDQLTAEHDWSVGENIGLLTAGTTYLHAIIEQAGLITPDFNAISMPP